MIRLTAGPGKIPMISTKICRLILVVVTILVCSFITTAGGSLALASPSLYSYMTANELVVMRNTEVVVRAPVTRSRVKFPPGMVWTSNGRYVAVVTDGNNDSSYSKERMLVAIDTVKGSTRRLPCPDCVSIAPLSSSQLVVSQDEVDERLNSMLRFDLSKTAPPVQFPIDIELYHAVFASGFAGQVLVIGETRQAETKQPEEGYFLLDANGFSKQLGTRNYRTDSSGRYYARDIGRTASIRTIDGSTVFAVSAAFKSRNARCGQMSEVFAYSPATQESVDTDLSALDPPGYTIGYNAEVTILDLWWDQRDQLHAILASRICGNPNKFTTPPSEWQLTNGRWAQVRRGNLLAVRELSDGTAAVVRLPTTLSDNGQLDLEVTGRSSKIADNVFEISAPTLARHVLSNSGTRSDDACLLGIGRELGTRNGEIDGDGKIDHVSLTLCAARGYKDDYNRIIANVSVGNGGHLTQAISRAANEAADWLGISDMNGDKHGEVVVVENGGTHSRWAKAFEFRNGRLALLRGDLSEGLNIDNSLASDTGFACDSQGKESRARLTLISTGLDSSLSPPQYIGDETIYEADASGAMRQATKRRISYAAEPDQWYFRPPKTLTDQTGAHCSGLDNFPRG